MSNGITPQAANAFNQANAAFKAQEWEKALEGAEQALASSPSLLVAAILRARAMVQLGRLQDAAAAFADALKIDPGNFSAWLERGNALRRLGNETLATTCYERAVQAAPGDRRGHIALARVLEASATKTDTDKAAAHYHLSLTASGEAPAMVTDTHHRIGQYRLEMGNTPGALEALRAANTALTSAENNGLSPLTIAIQIDMADALLRLSLSDEAAACMQLASRTEDEAQLRRLADLAYRFNFWQEALRILERNVSLRPESGSAALAVADIAAKSWQLDKAQAALARAEALGGVPENALTVIRGTIAGKLGDPDAAIDQYRFLLDAGDTSIRSSIAMSALYSDRMTTEEVAALHRTLFADLGDGARSPVSFSNDRRTDRTLRIGMVSRDLHRQHPVNIFLQPMLAHWDQTAFPLTIYFTGNTRDEQTAQAQRRAGTWREVPAERLSQLPSLVEADRIDILIDLAGHTSSTQAALFGQRMAPVQATYLGYPGSTGVPNMDWLIGDAIVTPPEHDHLYSERVARLPGTVFCFAPGNQYPPPFFPAEAAMRPLTFGSFNNIPKMTPRTIRLWSAILRALPDSRLLLKAASFQDRGAIARYQTLFAAEGVNADRLEFRGPTGLADMMQEYGDIDIALDPVPYNGGTTTLQALWMGAPVITMTGGHFVSRMGTSFMQAAGLPDWIAADDESYVQTAIRMAADRQTLLALKRGLRARLQSLPAWNSAAFTQAFQQQLALMWRAHAQ